MDQPSLADLIRAGDPDAIAGFRDAHAGKVRDYCAEACLPERVDEACEAVFTEFVGRVVGSPSTDPPLEELLLTATRSAAAGRFRVVRVPGTHRSLRHSSDGQLCELMPELLAARANGEFAGDREAIQQHVDHCPTCSGTDARMLLAQRAFLAAPAWVPALAEPDRTEEEEAPAEASVWTPAPADAQRGAAEEAPVEASAWIPDLARTESGAAEEAPIEAEQEPTSQQEPTEQEPVTAEPESPEPITAEPAPPQPVLAEPEQPPEPSPDEPPPIAPYASPTPTIRKKRRQGGLVGASRRLLGRALGSDSRRDRS